MPLTEALIRQLPGIIRTYQRSLPRFI